MGGSEGGDRGDWRCPPTTYESSFIHHDFFTIWKNSIRVSRHKSILSCIVLSQQCCEVNFIPFTVAKPLWDLTTKYYWNLTPPNLTGCIRPWPTRVEKTRLNQHLRQHEWTKQWVKKSLPVSLPGVSILFAQHTVQNFNNWMKIVI